MLKPKPWSLQQIRVYERFSELHLNISLGSIWGWQSKEKPDNSSSTVQATTGQPRAQAKTAKYIPYLNILSQPFGRESPAWQLCKLLAKQITISSACLTYCLSVAPLFLWFVCIFCCLVDSNYCVLFSSFLQQLLLLQQYSPEQEEIARHCIDTSHSVDLGWLRQRSGDEGEREVAMWLASGAVHTGYVVKQRTPKNPFEIQRLRTYR